VDQYGRVMAIGGVNEKIEGFFEVCRKRGLTGLQGVIIPKANEKNLMLEDEVITAVRAGQFHIYSVASVDEGLTLLMGEPVGAQDDMGVFPPDSIHGKVAARLDRFAKAGSHDDESDDEEADDDEVDGAAVG
jgi:predicted ATP-dependent protease